jgi:hypothetical protein
MDVSGTHMVSPHMVLLLLLLLRIVCHHGA